MTVSGLDFNLLVPLQALLELRHVSRAAEKVHLSQSAMSATLSRLRRHLGDELLVRAEGRYVLTPLAQSLLPLVNDAVRAAEVVLGAGAGFDPTESQRRFVITASNYAAGVVGPPLRASLAEYAPHVSVEFHAMPKHALAERDILASDLVIGPQGYGLPGVSRWVFCDDFVCLVDRRHILASHDELTPALLGGWPHVGVTFAPAVPTAADRLLDRLGVSRQVALLADDWLPLPWLIRDTDLIAVLPRRVAEWASSGGGYFVRELPGTDSAPFDEAAFYHPSRAGDAGLRWLADILSLAVGKDGSSSAPGRRLV